MLETMLAVVFSPGGSMVIGALITIAVAHCYYLQASRDLRWEARAGAIQQSTLDLLVAYVDWGKDLRTDQGISIGGNNNQPNCGIFRFKHVLKLLKEAGLANAGVTFFAQSVDTEGDGTVQENYSTLSITNEGVELARYLKKARGIDCKVVELFGMPPDKQTLAPPVECLWTIVPGKKPGPIDEYWKRGG